MTLQTITANPAEQSLLKLFHSFGILLAPDMQNDRN